MDQHLKLRRRVLSVRLVRIRERSKGKFYVEASKTDTISSYSLQFNGSDLLFDEEDDFMVLIEEKIRIMIASSELNKFDKKYHLSFILINADTKY